uniref:Uncharacterized protein n=1 Tax=Meloidogyne enterolobii TaxID=390850 RepID=A0A6V7XXJ7_MELEN|nr:unnamed protein product [Meloidogyne enterolobii]
MINFSDMEAKFYLIFYLFLLYLIFSIIYVLIALYLLYGDVINTPINNVAANNGIEMNEIFVVQNPAFVEPAHFEEIDL